MLIANKPLAPQTPHLRLLLENPTCDSGSGEWFKKAGDKVGFGAGSLIPGLTASRGGAQAAPGMRWWPTVNSPGGEVEDVLAGMGGVARYGVHRAVWMKGLDGYY